VLVTRPREESGELVRRLSDLGAAAMAAPTIRFRTGDAAGLTALRDEEARGAFTWVVFTSARGVRTWFEQAGDDLRPRARVAAVGSGTADALRDRGVEPDLVPARYTTEGLAEAFPAGSGRVLLPRADLATGDLEAALAGKGWSPMRVEAYRIELVGRLPDSVVGALARDEVDAVTFTSASTVQGFARATGHRPTAVCIGPVTEQAARRAGFPIGGSAASHTIEGVVDAVVRLLGPGARG
jgi:uroporphyrinogen-III synthase